MQQKESTEDPLKQGFRLDHPPVLAAEIPSPVIDELSALKYSVQDLLLAVRSDLGSDGRFG
ncbi:MAG TPA: hypothetical protein ENL34_06010, partial [Chloroflexi bacterium]|nr:hypothetical protein [Chloroflexota bacterium]